MTDIEISLILRIGSGILLGVSGVTSTILDIKFGQAIKKGQMSQANNIVTAKIICLTLIAIFFVISMLLHSRSEPGDPQEKPKETYITDKMKASDHYSYNLRLFIPCRSTVAYEKRTPLYLQVVKSCTAQIRHLTSHDGKSVYINRVGKCISVRHMPVPHRSIRIWTYVPGIAKEIWIKPRTATEPVLNQWALANPYELQVELLQVEVSGFSNRIATRAGIILCFKLRASLTELKGRI